MPLSRGSETIKAWTNDFDFKGEDPMSKANEKTFSLAARYKDIIAAKKNQSAGDQAQKNATEKQQGLEIEAGKCFEVFGMALAFFLFAAPAFAGGMSSVSVGASVEFMRYEPVKMLGQVFLVEMKQDAKAATSMVTDAKGRNIMIIL